MIKRARSRSGARPVRIVGALLVCAAIGYVAWRGWSFYRLPLDLKPDHPDFRTLRPSGLIGQGYGVAATVLVLLNLAYLIRRRFASSSMGSMRAWLDAHVFTGLLAGVFAAAHSAGQMRTPLASVTAVSLFVVIVSGLIGRYLFALTAARTNVGLGGMLGGLEMYTPGFSAEVRAALVEIPAPNPPLNASIFSAITAVVRSRACARARRASVRALADRHLATLTIAPATRQDVTRRMAAVCVAVAKEARAGGTNAFLRSWRALHRLFAIIMIVTVVVHIGVAWYYGYRWVFSS